MTIRNRASIRRAALFGALAVLLAASAPGCIYNLYKSNTLASTSSTFDVKGYAPSNYRGVTTTPGETQFVGRGQRVYLLARDWTGPLQGGWAIPWRVVTSVTTSTSVAGHGLYDWVGYSFNGVSLPSWAWRTISGKRQATLMVSESTSAKPWDHLAYMTGFTFDDADALACYRDHLATNANMYDTGNCGSMSMTFDMIVE